MIETDPNATRPRFFRRAGKDPQFYSVRVKAGSGVFHIGVRSRVCPFYGDLWNFF